MLDTRLYVFAEINLKPEFYTQGKAAIEGIIERTLEEDGCDVFALTEGREDSGKLYLFEIFHDEAALAFHYEQPFVKSIFTSYQEWLAEPVKVTKMSAATPLTSMQFSS